MKRAALIVFGILLLGYVAAIFLPFDPEDRRPGTRLSGDLAVNQDTDWSFFGANSVRNRQEIQLETRSAYLVRHSITVNAWAQDGTLYVGCRRCDRKYWQKNVARDNRVRLKVEGKIYERMAVRLNDDGRRELALVPSDEPLPDMAVFRMDRI